MPKIQKNTFLGLKISPQKKIFIFNLDNKNEIKKISPGNTLNQREDFSKLGKQLIEKPNSFETPSNNYFQNNFTSNQKKNDYPNENNSIKNNLSNKNFVYFSLFDLILLR